MPSRKLPEVKPTKACANCANRFDAEILGLKETIQEIGKLGITRAAVQRFVTSTTLVHNEDTVSMLASFVAATAQGKRKNPKKDAAELIRTYIKIELVMSMKVRKAMVITTEESCEWHGQQPDVDNSDEPDGQGPVPPSDPAFR